MRPNLEHELFFILQLEIILRSNLNSATCYGRSTDLKSLLGLLLLSFIWLGERISLTYLLIGGGGERLSPISRRCRNCLCPNWLKSLWDDLLFFPNLRFIISGIVLRVTELGGFFVVCASLIDSGLCENCMIFKLLIITPERPLQDCAIFWHKFHTYLV